MAVMENENLLVMGEMYMYCDLRYCLALDEDNLRGKVK